VDDVLAQSCQVTLSLALAVGLLDKSGENLMVKSMLTCPLVLNHELKASPFIANWLSPPSHMFFLERVLWGNVDRLPGSQLGNRWWDHLF